MKKNTLKRAISAMKRRKCYQERLKDWVIIGQSYIERREGLLRKNLTDSFGRIMKRLVLDLDHPTLWHCFLVINRLCVYGSVLELQLSSSGSGLHISCLLPDDSLDTRIFFGDDSLRAFYDQRRPKYLRMVRFKQKKVKLVEELLKK